MSIEKISLHVKDIAPLEKLVLEETKKERFTSALTVLFEEMKDYYEDRYKEQLFEWAVDWMRWFDRYPNNVKLQDQYIQILELYHDEPLLIDRIGHKMAYHFHHYSDTEFISFDIVKMYDLETEEERKAFAEEQTSTYYKEVLEQFDHMGEIHEHWMGLMAVPEIKNILQQAIDVAYKTEHMDVLTVVERILGRMNVLMTDYNQQAIKRFNKLLEKNESFFSVCHVDWQRDPHDPYDHEFDRKIHFDRFRSTLRLSAFMNAQQIQEVIDIWNKLDCDNELPSHKTYFGRIANQLEIFPMLSQRGISPSKYFFTRLKSVIRKELRRAIKGEDLDTLLDITHPGSGTYVLIDPFNKEAYKFGDDLDEEFSFYQRIPNAKHVVQCKRYDKEKGMLVLKHVEGRPLIETLTPELGWNWRTEYISPEPLQEEDILNVGLGVILGFEELREGGLYYRDLHPLNIMYDKKTMNATLIDLGAATTNPEEIHPLNRAYGGNNDLLSLGLILYKLATTHNLFSEEFDSTDDYKDDVREEREKAYSLGRLSEEYIKKIMDAPFGESRYERDNMFWSASFVKDRISFPGKQKSLKKIILYMIYDDLWKQPSIEKIREVKRMFEWYELLEYADYIPENVEEIVSKAVGSDNIIAKRHPEYEGRIEYLLKDDDCGEDEWIVKYLEDSDKKKIGQVINEQLPSEILEKKHPDFDLYALAYFMNNNVPLEKAEKYIFKNTILKEKLRYSPEEIHFFIQEDIPDSYVGKYDVHVDGWEMKLMYDSGFDMNECVKKYHVILNRNWYLLLHMLGISKEKYSEKREEIEVMFLDFIDKGILTDRFRRRLFAQREKSVVAYPRFDIVPTEQGVIVSDVGKRYLIDRDTLEYSQIDLAIVPS